MPENCKKFKHCLTKTQTGHKNIQIRQIVYAENKCSMILFNYLFIHSQRDFDRSGHCQQPTAAAAAVTVLSDI